MLELLGFEQPAESPQPHGGLERPVVGARLHPVLQPALLLRVLDIHVLAADLAAVSLAQRLKDLAVQVLNREAVMRRVELGVIGRLAPQRIEIGDQVPAHAVGVD